MISHGKISLRWRNVWIRAALLCGLAALVWLSLFLLRRTSPFEIQSLLSATNPIRIGYERYLESFDDENTILVAIHDIQPFTVDQLSRISLLAAKEIELYPGVESVTGPHNAQYFKFDQMGFQLVPFIKDGRWTADAAAYLNVSPWKGRIIDDDRQTFLLRIKFNQRFLRKDEKPFVDDLSSSLHQILSPSMSFGVLGAKAASSAFLGEMQFQQRVITPILIIILMGFFYFCFRSLSILVYSLFVMFVCYALTLCLIILIEGGLGPYSSFALMFSVIVSTTDLLHFFGRYQQLSNLNLKPLDRLNRALEISKIPCLLTSLTTAAGFLALIVNQNLPIRYFGLYCAFACMAEWIVIFYILPPILNAFSVFPKTKVFQVTTGIEKFQKLICRHARAISYGSLVLIAVSLLFSFRLKVDDNYYTKFKADHPLSKSVQLFMSQFEFGGSIDLVIKSRDTSLDPLSMNVQDSLRAFESDLSSFPTVSQVQGFREISDRIFLEIQRHSPIAADEIRKSLLGLFVNYRTLTDFFNERDQEFRTTIVLKSLSTSDLDSTMAYIEKLKTKFGSELDIRPSGFAVIRSYINMQVVTDLFHSFFLTFVLIFICYLFLYKNAKWALLALIPNLIPLLAISSLMGLFNVPVDTNLVILICVAFGIVGDNTVHLTYILNQQIAKGFDFESALRYGLELIGLAIVATSAVFLVCLPVFLLGNLKLFEHVALFLSAAFLLALISDLIFFPALQKALGYTFTPLPDKPLSKPELKLGSFARRAPGASVQAESRLKANVP